VIVWAQKYRVEEGGYQEEVKSWFLNLLRRTQVLPTLAALRHRLVRRLSPQRKTAPRPPENPRREATRWARGFSLAAFLVLIAGLGFGTWQLALLLLDVPLAQWAEIGGAAGLTLGRVVLALVIGTAWTLPAGLAIGLSPRLSRILQPVIQIVASFPAPMLFWAVALGMQLTGITLGWGSILLMLLGTQWYILFNVIAGAMAIPADLKEAAHSYRIGGWQRFWVLYAPGVFPYLVTGWVTAAGGAWNASIIAEYLTLGEGTEPLTAPGLGSMISQATKYNVASTLAASVLVMSVMVVAFNRLVWRRLYRLAEERFSLAK
jgi:NitT/TauT family transport system permease protein